MSIGASIFVSFYNPLNYLNYAARRMYASFLMYVTQAELVAFQ